MELKRLMTRFLSKWWTSSATSTADDQQPISVLPEEPLPEGGLTQAVAGHESVARFIFNQRDFPGGNVKPKVFMPEYWQGAWETSVCRLTACDDQRVWSLGSTVRTGMVALARADLSVEVAHGQALMVQAAPMVDEGYHEHAVILGWPHGDPETIKSQHKLVAAVLASEAQLRESPDGTA